MGFDWQKIIDLIMGLFSGGGCGASRKARAKRVRSKGPRQRFALRAAMMDAGYDRPAIKKVMRMYRDMKPSDFNELLEAAEE